MIQRLILASAALLSGHAAIAQSLPADLSIDQRVRTQLPGLSPDEELKEAIMTGEDDIILLRKSKLFTLTGGINWTNSSNAFLSPGTSRDDNYFVADAGLRVATRIADKVNLFAGVGVATVRYLRFTELDYSALNGIVGASLNVGRVDTSLTYQPSMIFNRDFGSRQLTQHRFGLSAGIPFRIKRAVVNLSARGERTLTDPDDYRSWAVGGDVALQIPLTPNGKILAFANAGAERRWYDSYFPGLVGVDRRDTKIDGTAGLRWRIKPWLDASAQVSYQRNKSTSDVNGYRAWQGMVGVSLNSRF